MDNSETTNSSEPDLPGEGQSSPAQEPLRDVLEGEVFDPQRQDAGGAVEQEEGGAGNVAGDTREGASADATQRENVERGLAQYVFLREERDREVRLMFRDASPADIAHTFLTAGAHLITLSAERASMSGGHVITPGSADKEPGEEAPHAGETSGDGGQLPRRRAARQRSSKASVPTGEVLLRYFYSLGETVYTVSIVSATGVAASIAGMYPLAARSERELTKRLSIVFV